MKDLYLLLLTSEQVDSYIIQAEERYPEKMEKKCELGVVEAKDCVRYVIRYIRAN